MDRDLAKRRRLAERVRRLTDEAVGKALDQPRGTRWRPLRRTDIEPSLLRELLVERPAPAEDAQPGR